MPNAGHPFASSREGTSAFVCAKETNQTPWVYPTPGTVAPDTISIGAGVTDHAIDLDHWHVPQRISSKLPMARTVPQHLGRDRGNVVVKKTELIIGSNKLPPLFLRHHMVQVADADLFIAG